MNEKLKSVSARLDVDLRLAALTSDIEGNLDRHSQEILDKTVED